MVRELAFLSGHGLAVTSEAYASRVCHRSPWRQPRRPQFCMDDHNETGGADMSADERIVETMDWFQVVPPPAEEQATVRLEEIDHLARIEPKKIAIWKRSIHVTHQEGFVREDVGFDALLENQDLTRNLKSEREIEFPTAIQATAIPILADGGDCVIRSHTGTGKTLAYLLPVLEAIDSFSDSTQALILAPSRELAVQIAGECKDLTDGLDVRCTSVIGGANPGRQLERIKKTAPHVVVGTPGKISELSQG